MLRSIRDTSVVPAGNATAPSASRQSSILSRPFGGSKFRREALSISGSLGKPGALESVPYRTP
ncbi:Uncharacterised protein [Mycobacterium tuberculosis]|nr:Uncharacterised protein [Mycobacterium tuberculosis]